MNEIVVDTFYSFLICFHFHQIYVFILSFIHYSKKEDDYLYDYGQHNNTLYNHISIWLIIIIIYEYVHITVSFH